MNGWVYLGIGIVVEVVGTLSMKLSYGFTKLIPSILCVVFFIIALVMVNLSMKTIDMSIVYAIWSGVGIALIALLGFLFLGEVVTPMKLMFIALIVIGVIGLHHHA